MKKLLISALFVLYSQCAPMTAHADEVSRPIRAWPFFSQEVSENHTETDILWPIFHYEREKSHTRYALRPFLFSTESDPEKDYRETSFLWPLSNYHRKGPELSSHIFPIYWHGRSPAGRYNVIFPIYWSGEGKDYSYFHLWPLFGTNREAGLTEYSMLFPFFRYGRGALSNELKIDAPWPILHFHRKADLVSHHFLPLYWYERRPDQSSGFVLPYYWKNTPELTTRGIFPIWYSSHGAELKTDLLIPFYFDRETSDGYLRFITPLYISRQTEETHLNTLIPIFLNYETPKERLMLITPLYISVRSEESKLDSLIPIFLNYRKQDFGLKIGLPLYLRYRSGTFLFSSFFPFYYHSQDTQLRMAFTYYFPFYGSYQRGDSVSRHFILFPLYSRLEDEGLQLKAWDVVWPLVHYETSPSMLSIRVLPFYWRTKTPEYGLTVGFPLYWSFTSGENSYRHLLPFYGVHTKGNFYTKRFVLGPVFMDTHDTRTGLSQQDILFPLFSRMHQGETERSWLIPFFYHRSDSNSRLTLGSIALAPPYYINKQEPGEKLLHIWPFYGYKQEGTYQEYSTLWPLIRVGKDPDNDLSMVNILLFYQKRQKDESSRAILPLWWHETTPKTSLDSTLLLHWYKHDMDKEKTQLSFLWLIPPEVSLIQYEREPGVLKHRFFPIYSYQYNIQTNNLRWSFLWPISSYRRDPITLKHRFFPLYSYEQNKQTDALRWSLLWPLFSYSSRGEFVQETGFLWKVITYERKDAETSDFRFLWRFIRNSKTTNSSIFEFNPLYYYESEKGKGSYWAILGGLIGRETTPEGHKKMRLLWIF